MKKPDYHIFVCLSFRGLEPKGKCVKKDAVNTLQYLEAEVADRGINAFVSSAGCLQFCDEGPIMVVYPQGWWYGGIDSEEKIDAVLEAMEQGNPCEEYLLK